jgi:hypothetical protein
MEHDCRERTLHDEAMAALESLEASLAHLRTQHHVPAVIDELQQIVNEIRGALTGLIGKS